MKPFDKYLETVEAQVRRDGFMTTVMRRNLEVARNLVGEPALRRRIDGLIETYHAPYVMPGMESVKGMQGVPETL